MTRHPGVLSVDRSLDAREAPSFTIGLDQLNRLEPTPREPAIAGDAQGIIAAEISQSMCGRSISRRDCALSCLLVWPC